MIKLVDLMPVNANMTESKLDRYLTPVNGQNYRTDNNISLVWGRNMKKANAWYGLRKDGWFRKYFGPGDNVGLQIRKFKVTSPNGKYIVDKGVAWPVAISYLPLEFDDMRDDVKTNYAHFRGYLVIGDKARALIDEKDVEKFVNANLKKYVP